MKALISDARVASTGDAAWTVRFKELWHDVEGSRQDWSYVFHVAKD
jgi:hypothetical protein